MRIHLFILIVSLLVVGCKKNDPKNMITISGTIVQSCTDPTPFANKKVYVSGDKSTGPWSCGKQEVSTYTDENGYFKLEYNLHKDLCGGKSSGRLHLSYNSEFGNSDIICGLPWSKEEEIPGDRTYYLHNQYLFEYYVKTDKPYTVSDTLILYRINEEPIEIAGPFEDNQLVQRIDQSWGGSTYNPERNPNAFGYRVRFLQPEKLVEYGYPTTNFDCGDPNKMIIELR